MRSTTWNVVAISILLSLNVSSADQAAIQPVRFAQLGHGSKLAVNMNAAALKVSAKPKAGPAAAPANALRGKVAPGAKASPAPSGPGPAIRAKGLDLGVTRDPADGPRVVQPAEVPNTLPEELGVTTWKKCVDCARSGAALAHPSLICGCSRFPARFSKA